MKFTIRFRIDRNAQRWKITWDNGRLIGHETVKLFIKRHMTAYNKIPFRIGAVGPVRTGNILKDPLLFLTVCQETFYNVVIEGNTPVFQKNNKIV